MTDAPIRSHRAPSQPPPRSIRGVVLRVAGAVGIVVVVIALVVTVAAAAFGVSVDGPSMQPTLHTGQRLLSNPLDRAPHRGDVVTLREPPHGADIVKRVIGLPGDTVAIAPYDGTPVVWIRPAGSTAWQRLAEPYESGDGWTKGSQCCSADGKAGAPPHAVTVPAGDYWVLGDNREPSVDSRSFGFVPKKDIEGTVVWRLWPFGHFAADRPTLVPAVPPPALQQP